MRDDEDGWFHWLYVLVMFVLVASGWSVKMLFGGFSMVFFSDLFVSKVFEPI
jgi:cytochrome b subunit of formate dehydrogenase